MYIDEKINQLQNLIKRKVTYDELVPILGVGSSNALRNWNYRKRKLKEYEILKIDKAFGIAAQSTDNKDCVSVIYRPNVYLSAGYGIEVLDETNETMLIDKRLLVTDRGNYINPKNCEIVRISGNSMSPEYRHGDRVIIDKGDTELIDGHIFAFRYKGACYVKELNLLGDKLKCISLNKEYDSFYINKNEDFTVLGRIIPRVRL